jgi:hypothetical protein
MALPQKRSARNIIILMETIKTLYISAQTPTVPSAPSCRRDEVSLVALCHVLSCLAEEPIHEQQPRFLVSHLVGNRAGLSKK